MKIFLTEPTEIAQSAKDMLNNVGHLLVDRVDKDIDESIEVLFIRSYTTVNQTYLDRFPNLSVIIRAGTGLDNIDLVLTKQRNIHVISSPGSNAYSVAEHALSMILILLKNIFGHAQNLSLGSWRSKELQGLELRGKTVGLIGCGAVGKHLAQLLLPFGVKMLGYDKYLPSDTFADLSIVQVELDTLLKSSNIISIQVPLTPETTNLIGHAQLAMMKPSSYLVNVSRGEVIDESALFSALNHHTIKGAAVDVVVGEPSPNKRLFALNNLIITPHVAGFTQEADEAIAVDAVHNFLKYLEDQK